MIVSQALSRLGAELAAHPLFWIVLAAMLAAITFCSACWFERRWLRAGVSGLLGVQCAWLLCSGFIG